MFLAVDLPMIKRLKLLERAVHGNEFPKLTQIITEETLRQSGQLFSADFMKRKKVIIVATPVIKKHNKCNRKSQVFNHLDPQ